MMPSAYVIDTLCVIDISPTYFHFSPSLAQFFVYVLPADYINRERKTKKQEKGIVTVIFGVYILVAEVDQ